MYQALTQPLKVFSYKSNAQLQKVMTGPSAALFYWYSPEAVQQEGKLNNSVEPTAEKCKGLLIFYRFRVLSKLLSEGLGPLAGPLTLPEPWMCVQIHTNQQS